MLRKQNKQKVLGCATLLQTGCNCSAQHNCRNGFAAEVTETLPRKGIYCAFLHRVPLTIALPATSNSSDEICIAINIVGTHFYNCYFFPANLLSRGSPKQCGSRSYNTTIYWSWRAPDDSETTSASNLPRLMGSNDVSECSVYGVRRSLTFSDGANPLGSFFIGGWNEIERECGQRGGSPGYAVRFWVSDLEGIALRDGRN